MKRNLIFLALLAALITAGCGLFNNPSGSNVAEMIPAISPPIVGNAKSVAFKIVLPGQTKQANNLLANIRASTATPTVTFKLTVINVGNVANPTTVLRKIVVVDASGMAQAIFTGIPARTVIADIDIASGTIASGTESYSNFHGALDLVADVDNVVEVSPKGSNTMADFLAEMLTSIVADATKFVKLDLGAVIQIKTVLVTFDLTGGDYTGAVSELITYKDTLPNLSAVTPSDTGNVVTWSPVASATSYNIYFRTTSGVTISNGTKLTGQTSPFTHTGLASGITYYYVVTAMSATGESDVSNEKSATTAGAIVIPNAPTISTVTPSNTKNTITWDDVSGAVSYNIYYAQSAGVTIANGTKLTGKTSPFEHADLTNDTTYYYVVTAVNSAGESVVSNEKSAKPIAPPDAPQNVQVSPANNVTNIVSWNELSWATEYDIYWLTTAGVTKASGQKISVAASPYQHSGLSNANTYYYIVIAKGSNLESVASSEVSGSPLSVSPTLISLSNEVVGQTQNVQVILTNVPTDFTSTIGLVDKNSEKPFYLTRSSTLSWPNARKVTFAINEYTLKEVQAFSSLSFSVAPPAGAQIDVWDPDQKIVLASATIDGGSKGEIGFDSIVSGLTQNMQVIITGVTDAYSVTATVYDKSTREELQLTKSATLSFPNYQRLVLTLNDFSLREIDSIATMTFSAPLTAGIKIEIFDPDTQQTVASKIVPGAGQVLDLGSSISGLNQNLQVIISNVPDTYNNSTVVYDSRTGEQILMTKSDALSFPDFQRVLLAVSNISLHEIRAFDSLVFSEVLPHGANISIYNPDTEETIKSIDIP